MRSHTFDRRQASQLRERAKLSQLELADRVGEKIGRTLDQSHISLIENGKREPSFEVAEGICHVLGVDVDELIEPKPAVAS